MIAKAGFAVFLSGNKLAGAKIVSAEGVREEFDIAVARRAYPIPVGATGHVAAAPSDRGDVESTRYFGAHAAAVAKPLAKLNDAKASNEQLLEAIFSVVKAVAPK